MHKYNDIIGIPIICIKNKQNIGYVKDIIFCSEQKKIVAFLINFKKKHLTPQIILLKDVVTIGKDALIIQDDSCLTNLIKAKKKKIFTDKIVLKNMKVYCRHGTNIGLVKNVFFDHKTGCIDALEVSGSLLEDLSIGRQIIPLIGRVEFGQDNIIIDKDVLEETLSTNGGLKNILNRILKER